MRLDKAPMPLGSEPPISLLYRPMYLTCHKWGTGGGGRGGGLADPSVTYLDPLCATMHTSKRSKAIQPGGRGRGLDTYESCVKVVMASGRVPASLLPHSCAGDNRAKVAGEGRFPTLYLPFRVYLRVPV
jgi:hypothetical protein